MYTRVGLTLNAYIFNPDGCSTHKRGLEAASCQGLVRVLPIAEPIRIMWSALENSDAWAPAPTNAA